MKKPEAGISSQGRMGRGEGGRGGGVCSKSLRTGSKGEGGRRLKNKINNRTRKL